MLFSLLAALLLAVPASAEMPTCKINEMTSAWEKVTFGLWLSDYTIPDSTPRTATLTYKGCSVGDEGEESRSYSSADGAYIVTAFTNMAGENGATTLILTRTNRAVRLGTWGHHKVFYKGVGIDKVSVPNGGDASVVKNVFVIPVYDKP